MSQFYHFNHRIVLRRQATKKEERKTSVAFTTCIEKALIALARSLNAKYKILQCFFVVRFFWYELG